MCMDHFILFSLLFAILERSVNIAERCFAVLSMTASIVTLSAAKGLRQAQEKALI